jgi:hypothetical protein
MKKYIVCILKVTEERSRIGSRIQIRIHYRQNPGLGSTPEMSQIPNIADKGSKFCCCLINELDVLSGAVLWITLEIMRIQHFRSMRIQLKNYSYF